jgi:hypothetical protein
VARKGRVMQISNFEIKRYYSDGLVEAIYNELNARFDLENLKTTEENIKNVIGFALQCSYDLFTARSDS